MTTGQRPSERTLVIIPTYNERENLAAICEAVLEEEPRADILVVDDNSPDGTGALADALAKREPRVQVLHRPVKDGLGRAYLAAFRLGLSQGYPFIVQMDADFSHHPRYLPALIDRALAGADLAVGSRYVLGGGTVNWGIGRQVMSRGASIYARSILGIHVQDTTAGFKCFRREVLERIDLGTIHSSGYAFQIETTYRTLRAGFRLEEVPIVFEDRRVGLSKMSRRIFAEAVEMVWRLRWDTLRGRL